MGQWEESKDLTHGFQIPGRVKKRPPWILNPFYVGKAWENMWENMVDADWCQLMLCFFDFPLDTPISRPKKLSILGFPGASRGRSWVAPFWEDRNGQRSRFKTRNHVGGNGGVVRSRAKVIAPNGVATPKIGALSLLISAGKFSMRNNINNQHLRKFILYSFLIHDIHVESPCVCNVTLKTVTSRSREISPTEPWMVCRRAESVDSFRREVIAGDSDRWQICVHIYIHIHNTNTFSCSFVNR